jgi:hypothetical protein
MFPSPFDTLKYRFIDFTKVVLQDVQEANCEFSEPFAYLNHLSDFVQVAFFVSHDAENLFAWPFDISKHRFINFTTVVF